MNELVQDIQKLVRETKPESLWWTSTQVKGSQLKAGRDTAKRDRELVEGCLRLQVKKALSFKKSAKEPRVMCSASLFTVTCIGDRHKLGFGKLKFGNQIL